MKNKKTPKQILAIVGIVLLLLLYASTLVSALLDDPNTLSFVAASVAGTILIPVFLWVIMIFWKNREK